MSRRRRFLLLAAFAVCASAWTAAPATAARPVLPEKLTTQHFAVHYTGDPGLPEAILHQQAGDLAAEAESAYDKLVSWGFPPPLDDGDGRIDVYVVDLPLGFLGYAYPETASGQTYGYIELDESAVTSAETVAHELFHLVQFRLWSYAEPWLLEATAEWAAFKSVDFPASVISSLGTPEMSLSCSGDACSFDAYESGGYARWSFFEYVAEKYGASAVKEVFDRGAALADPSLPGIDLVSSMLSTRGATLAEVFTGWTVANMSGSYTALGLQGIVPPSYSTTFAGIKAQALPTQRVSVNHLAARYLKFVRGDGATNGVCYAATLNLDVALPAGIGAKPSFFWTAKGSAVVPLAVSGTSASISLPWDTCAWPKEIGLLSLPNPSTTADAQVFKVSGSLVVDTKTIVTATSPPPSTVTGPTVTAPTVDLAPAISVYGPELLRLTRRERVIRLVVFSSGPGKLEASLGGRPLETKTLRAGNNDVRLKLAGPASRVVSQRSTLTLTSMSPAGDKGATVTKRVTVVRR